MKGWQNYVCWSQKNVCQNDIVMKIRAFENCQFLESWNDGFLKYNVPLKQCFSLQNLIDSLRFHFVKIYKGQALLISNQIIEHLIQLHSSNVFNFGHGQLEPKNIFISLKNIKQQQVTIYQEEIQIDKIYFMNYLAIEDKTYQVNQKQDVYQLGQSLIALMKSMEDFEKCDLLKLIVDQIKKITIDNLQSNLLANLKNIFDDLILKHVDYKKQYIKSEKYVESPKHSAYIGLRYRSQSSIMKYIEQFSAWDLGTKIEAQISEISPIDTDQNQPGIYKNQRILLEEENISQEQVEINKILKDTIRNKIMNTFWHEFGGGLQNSTFSLANTIKTFQDRIFIYQDSLNNWQKKIKNTKEECLTFPQKIKTQIFQQFKFEAFEDQDVSQKINFIFIQITLNKFQQFDILKVDMNDILQEINDAIYEEILNYYNEQKETKILQLIADLI